MTVAQAIRIERLSIALPDGRTLLKHADLDVATGAFILLVGVSGSGKSTLLRLIAGLDGDGQNGAGASGLRITGTIRVAGQDASRNVPGRVGLVFQNHALFDELSAVDNVRFAIDHRTAHDGEAPTRTDRASAQTAPPASSADRPRVDRRGAIREAEALLSRLRVPLPGRLSRLSGGERQRVAVARTLAMNPPTILFDEPTAGLDPQRARAVADLVAETHRASGSTVVVVTHDYRPFLPHEPRLVLLDHDQHALCDVSEDELAACFAGKRSEPSDTAARPPTGGVAARGARLLPWLEAPGAALLTLVDAMIAPFAAWRRPRWKLRYLWHYARVVLVGTTAIYVALAGAMLGFVTVFFGFSQFPYREVTVPLLTEEFLAAAGYSTYRVLIPLLIAILVAAKCGAAIAADVGARRLTHQYDAMRSLGVAPRGYLYGNIVMSLVAAGPVLTLVAFLAACYTSLTAFLMTFDDASVAMFTRHFFATVWPPDRAVPKGTGWVMLKGVTGGMVTAALAYSIGSRPKQSSVDVSRDVGLTIFWATLAALGLHAVYAFLEF